MQESACFLYLYTPTINIKRLMFSNDKNIDNLEALYREIRQYVLLQGAYLKYDLVEKLTILLATLLLIFVLTVLGIMALFYFSYMLVYTLDSFVGSLIGSYAIIGVMVLLIAFGIYRFRRQLIFNPMVRFLSNLFLNNND